MGRTKQSFCCVSFSLTQKKHCIEYWLQEQTKGGNS